jgi:hypothetical protein
MSICETFGTYTLKTPTNRRFWTPLRSLQTVLTTAVRVHCLRKMDVRRIVMRDNAARTLFGDFCFRTWQFFIQQRVLPSIVFGMVPNRFKAPLRIGSGATSFDGVRNICH